MNTNSAALPVRGVIWRTASAVVGNHGADRSGSRRSPDQGKPVMIIDRALHFAIGYVVAFCGAMLLVPMISNVLGIG